jgi:flagellar hook-basal body complex protein FliE
MAEDFAVKQIQAELNRLRESMKPQGPAATQKQENSFGEMLKDAISEVNELAHEADKAVEQQAVSGDSTELHKTMIALQKAEVSFQTMMQIRNKILKAYEEIMRMPV